MTKNYRVENKPMRWSVAAFLLLLSPLSLIAQSKLISGKVRDASNNDFLPSVSITIKGSAKGSISDATGNYKIEASATETLVFSFIGYETQEILVGNRTNIDVALAVGVGNELNEVVVVGYGTQKKRDITGSVVSVSEATLKEVPAPNLLNALKGRAAGVSIVSNGSTPGSQASIRIRGNRSITTGNGDGLDGPL